MARILLIDDDNPLREIIAATLAQAGHAVTEAADGLHGVELFRAEPTDLVITDIIMPGREGIETIVSLHREIPDLPIIAMSGGASHSKFYLDMATKLGAQRTLAKPFSSAELLRTVDELLAQRGPDASFAP